MRVIVVGTGTEIGKTHVSACLLAQTRAGGAMAAAYKPVATGVTDRCEDAEVHATALGEPYGPPTFAYARPVSPHLAAREEKRPVDLAAIDAEAARRGEGKDVLLIETAGGLFSPLGETLTNADLVRRLRPARVLLVAPDRLGVLHDVRATLLASKAEGISIEALVLSAPSVPDSSTTTNSDELERLGPLAPVATFPRAAFDAPESLACAAKVWAALSLGSPSR